ncbi:MAG: pyruvate decarboxylase, partial [Betaproteobacteria bacterium]|nr:pyruvate decarboxylase [Betaproteobacteria bacterium]
MRTAGTLIVDTLVANGVSRVFCVPGESYLGLLDALHGRSDIDTVVSRHESGAGFMALADARLTGVPGVALVSRGPGASNAAIAVHTAQQDGVPFVLIVGQVSASDVRRDAFQEIDYARMYGGIAKWTAEVTDVARLPETLLRAFRVATQGVPGPVVLAIPEDVFPRTTDAEPPSPQATVRAAPDARDVATCREWLDGARRPVLLAGSGLDRPGGRDALRAFAERWALPVLVSFRRHDLFPNRHDLYAGDLGLAIPATQMEMLRTSDLLIAAGARLSDITTQGYAFPRLVRPEMKLVHVHSDPSVIGTHFSADLAIAADPRTFFDAVGSPAEVHLPRERTDWIERVRAERRRIAAVRPAEVSDGVPFERVVDAVGRHLTDDAIVTVDA